MLETAWFIVKQKSIIIPYNKHTILMFLKTCDEFGNTALQRTSFFFFFRVLLNSVKTLGKKEKIQD